MNFKNLFESMNWLYVILSLVFKKYNIILIEFVKKIKTVYCDKV